MTMRQRAPIDTVLAALWSARAEEPRRADVARAKRAGEVVRSCDHCRVTSTHEGLRCRQRASALACSTTDASREEVMGCSRANVASACSR